MDDNLEIATPRLVLRPLGAQDAPRLVEIGGVPEVARMLLSVPAPWPAAAAQAWIAASAWRGRIGFRLGVCCGGRLIGVVGLGGDPVTLMYFIAQEEAGQGYATEAVAGLLGWAFARFGLEAIEADHFIDNPASGHILRKLGFAEIGSGTGQSAARLEPAPLTLYRLTRANFEDATCNS